MKTGRFKWKFIFGHNETFMFKGFEYNLDQNSMYDERILVEKFKVAYYIQNNPNPIVFKDDKTYMNDVPLNEIAIISRRIIENTMYKLSMYASIGACVLAGACLYLLYQITQHLGVTL